MFGRLIVTQFLLGFLLATPLQPLDAQGLATPEPAGVVDADLSEDRLDALLRTIEDPLAREQFAERLRTLIAAQEGQSVATTTVEDLGIGLIELIGDRLNMAAQSFVELSNTIVDLPELTDWLASQSLDGNARAYWIEVIGRIGLLLLLAACIYHVVRWWLAMPLQNIDAAHPTDIAHHLRLLAKQALLRLAPIVAFGVVAHGALPFLNAPYATEVIAASLINASLTCMLLLLAARVLLAPQSPALRLFSLPDGFARYSYVWLRRFIIIIAFSYVLFHNKFLLEIPSAIYGTIERLIGFIVAVMAIVLVLQNRKPVAKWLKGGTAKDKQRGQSAVATIRHLIAEIWPLFAVFYVISTYLIWALDIPGGFSLLLRGALVTTFLLGIARPLAYGVHRFLGQNVDIGRTYRQRYPAFERRFNRYLAILRRFVVSLIYFGIILALVHIWGIDLFGWISSLFSDGFWEKARKIGWTLLTTFLIWELVSTLIENYLEAVDKTGNKLERSGRARTVLPLLRTVLFVIIGIVVFLTSLSTLGVDVTPMLAAAGIVGIAVGFGSQKLVQDLLGGMFILFQDTMAVGDFVQVAGHEGVVERLTLRTVHMRDLIGVAHTVPISEITTIKNYTKGYSCADLTITAAYKEDIDQVQQVIRDVGDELQASDEWGPEILQPIEVLGLDEFGDSAVVFKARIRTRKMKHLPVKRAFNRLLKLRFDELGIEIPFPHQTIIFGEEKSGHAAAARVQIEPTASNNLSPLGPDQRARRSAEA